MLNESLEDVKKSYAPEDHKLIDHIYHNILPSHNKSDRLLHHAVKTIKNDDKRFGIIFNGYGGDVRIQEEPDIRSAYNIVGKYNLQNKLSGVNSLMDLMDLTKPYKMKEEDQIAKKTSKVVYEDDKCIVKRHDTYESAREGAKLHPDNIHFHNLNVPGKANWCVSINDEAGRRYFGDVYTERGKHPMYTLEDKNTKRKYAIIANKDKRLSSIEIRDELDSMAPRTLIHSEYPKILLTDKSEFGDFARHLLVNHQINDKMIHDKPVSDSDFKSFIDHNLTPIDSDTGAVINNLHTYKNLEQGDNVKSFYGKELLKPEETPEQEILHASIIKHIDIDKDAANAFFEKNYDPSDFNPNRGMNYILSSKNLDVKHARKVLASNASPYLVQGAVLHPKITDNELLSTFISNNNPTTRRVILSNDNLSNHSLNHILDHYKQNGFPNDDDDWRQSALGHVLMHPLLSKEDISRLYHSTNNNYVKDSLINNKNTSSDIHHEYRKEILGRFPFLDNTDRDKVLNSWWRSTPTQEQFNDEVDGLSKDYVRNFLAPHRDYKYADFPNEFKQMYQKHIGDSENDI
jgi:hypothetical protein